jgi:hypothetical protein
MPQLIPSNYYAPIDGWYFKNSEPTSTTNNKFNWYIPVPPNTTFRDLQYLSFNAMFYSNLSLPFITFYTKPNLEARRVGTAQKKPMKF